MRKTLTGLCLWSTLTPLASAAQDSQPSSPQRSASTAPAANANQKELKADLEHMRILLGQMQRNVAFVSSGDTPLKHQFELEIEMWQLLINDMEKRIAAEHKQ